MERHEKKENPSGYPEDVHNIIGAALFVAVINLFSWHRTV